MMIDDNDDGDGTVFIRSTPY